MNKSCSNCKHYEPPQYVRIDNKSRKIAGYCHYFTTTLNQSLLKDITNKTACSTKWKRK